MRSFAIPFLALLATACGEAPLPPANHAHFDAIQRHEARLQSHVHAYDERGGDCAETRGACEASEAICEIAASVNDSDASARCTAAQQSCTRVRSACPE